MEHLLKVGFVGACHQAQEQIRILQSSKVVKVSAVSDIHADRSRNVGAKYQIPYSGTSLDQTHTAGSLLEWWYDSQFRPFHKGAPTYHLLSQCTQSKNHTKQIQRHLWEDALEEAEHLRHTDRNKQIYEKRKETIERVFADLKVEHGMRWTHLRGKRKVQHQAMLVFAAMNLKKLATWRWRTLRSLYVFIRNWVFDHLKGLLIDFQKSFFFNLPQLFDKQLRAVLLSDRWVLFDAYFEKGGDWIEKKLGIDDVERPIQKPDPQKNPKLIDAIIPPTKEKVGRIKVMYQQHPLSHYQLDYMPKQTKFWNVRDQIMNLLAVCAHEFNNSVWNVNVAGSRLVIWLIDNALSLDIVTKLSNEVGEGFKRVAGIEGTSVTERGIYGLLLPLMVVIGRIWLGYKTLLQEDENRATQ